MSFMELGKSQDKVFEYKQKKEFQYRTDENKNYFCFHKKKKKPPPHTPGFKFPNSYPGSSEILLRHSPRKVSSNQLYKRYKVLHTGKSIESATSTRFENTENFPYLPKSGRAKQPFFSLPNSPTAAFLTLI